MSYAKSLILAILENDGIDGLAEALSSIDQNDLERTGFEADEGKTLEDAADCFSVAAKRLNNARKHLV